MNRPSRAKPASIVFSLLFASLLLSGCISAPAVDSVAAPVEESASPEPEPSPSGTVAEEDSGESAGSGGESTAPPAQAPSTPAEPAPAPPPPPAPAPSPSPEAKTPAVSVISQKCVSSRLTVTMTASYSSGYRKGIRSVVVERPNEYNAWIDEDASWLGPETGQGNQWTVQPAGSRVQRFKDTLRITAKADDGSTTVLQVAITANC